MPGTLSGGRENAFLQRGHIDDTRRRAAVVLDTDHRAVERHAANKGFRAVNGIENPVEAGRAAGCTELFPEDAILREAGSNPLAQELLGRPVGDCDRRSVTLALNLEVILLKILERQPAG